VGRGLAATHEELRLEEYKTTFLVEVGASPGPLHKGGPTLNRGKKGATTGVTR